MAQFIHLTSHASVGHIRRSGIRAGKGQRGIYAMPATPNFYVSHQWLRELRRWKAGTVCAVYFRLDGATPVAFGPYGGPHVEGSADDAVDALMRDGGGLGFETLVPSPVAASRITSIRPLRQVTGWRYFPAAKGCRPCGCPYCNSPGKPYSRKLREAYEREQDEVRRADDDEAVE
jgi:hypothetical protein